MWIGIDDTDSPSGGCTTWVLTEILRRVTEFDLVGYPRLVRLNPNVPFKTRGNAALAARFGHGSGRPRVIGEVLGRPVRSYPRGRELSPEEGARVATIALTVLRESSRLGEEGTDPAIAFSPRLLPESLYLQAVQGRVDPQEAYSAAASVDGCSTVAYGSGQGIVGACASIAWRERRRTWEAIAYRPSHRWGTERRVDPLSVQRMEGCHPQTFASWDPATRRLLVTPHTPCPILFGVRARSPDVLARALKGVRSEPYERWVTFVTNQATGDHLRTMEVAELTAGTCPVLTGHVANDPVRLRGGHVRFLVEDPTGTVECMAFEPAKTLPSVAARLRPGDRLTVWGSVPWEGLAPVVHVEGLRVLKLVRQVRKVSNPRCPSCGGATRSQGRSKGFRCRSCHEKLSPESAPVRSVARPGLLGTHLPTLSARRHLAPQTLIRPVPFAARSRT